MRRRHRLLLLGLASLVLLLAVMWTVPYRELGHKPLIRPPTSLEIELANLADRAGITNHWVFSIRLRQFRYELVQEQKKIEQRQAEFDRQQEMLNSLLKELGDGNLTGKSFRLPPSWWDSATDDPHWQQLRRPKLGGERS